MRRLQGAVLADKRFQDSPCEGRGETGSDVPTHLPAHPRLFKTFFRNLLSDLLAFWIFASFLEVVLVTCRDFAKNTTPHELTVNTDQIEGQAPVKTSEKASRNQKKMMKTKTNK